MPTRVFKPRRRASSLRDAKLIVIAAEGTRTEKKYFEDLASDDAYRNPRVHVEVLERIPTASSPEYVMKGLDRFRNTFRLNENDELWLVIDLDKWGDEKLSEISTQCIQKGYLLAVSNPCFELWLLLHVAPPDAYSADELAEFQKNRRVNSARTRLDEELVKIVGRYNKSNLDTSAYIPYVETAIERARALDVNPEHRWPNHLGTRVYLLAKSVIWSSRL